MLRSMTGYGRGASTDQDYAVEAEIKSVNGKFLKIHSKLPSQLARFELEVEKLLKEYISRGTIDIYLKFENLSNPGGYRYNANAARGYMSQLQKIKDEIGIEGEVTFELLSTLPGVLEAEEESESEVEKLRPHITEAVKSACEKVMQMRLAEGDELKNDLAAHLDTLEKLLEAIRNRTPQAIEDYKERFKERVAQLLEGTDVTLREQDFAREVIFYVERSDVSEELARMASHISQFRQTMEAGGIVGRQLEFLGQEMHREANTMGSKSNDTELSNLITPLKTTVDKIREQVLNVE